MLSVEDLTQFALEPDNIASFGLRFLIYIRDAVMLGGGRVVDDLIKAVVNINKKTISVQDIVHSSIDQSADEHAPD